MTHAIRLAIVLSLIAVAIPVVLGQTMYKSVTADGKIIYSDHPPSDGKVLKTITAVSAPSTALPASTMEQLRKLRALRPAAAAPSNGVILYSASWCGYCAKAKAYLAAEGIAYQEIDIETSAGLASFARAGGGNKGVPLLLSGTQRIRGFSPAAYDQLFARRQ